MQLRKLKKLLLLLSITCCFHGVTEEVWATNNNKSNQLISYYEMMSHTKRLEKGIHASLNEVFKKKGFPDGHELTISHEKKEVIFVFRPYEKDDLQNMAEYKYHIEHVLNLHNIEGYDVLVLAYWNSSNVTKRQKREREIITDVANEMSKTRQVEVLPNIQCSSVDGHIESLELAFRSENEDIANVKQINNLHKEFIERAKEKGLQISKLPTFFIKSSNPRWGNTVIPVIDKGLKKAKDLQVTSTTVLDYDDPIVINTSIDSTDVFANKMGQRIEGVVHEFLEYEKIKKTFPSQVEIYVLSKDGKQIN